MKCLTRDEILQVKDLLIEAVDTPEWGADSGVFVRGLSGAERERFEASGIEFDDEGKVHQKQNTNAYARFAALCCCDQDGARIFTEADVDALSAKSSKALLRIWVVGQRLSGMDRESREMIKKNCEPTKPVGSGLS